MIGSGGGGGWGRGKSLAGVNRVEPSWIFSNLRRDSAVPAGPRPPSPEPRPCHPPQLGRLGLALLRCPRFPLPCQPPSPAQRLVLRTNRPSLAGALARPQKAWVSFDTAGLEGMARQTPPPPPKGCTGCRPAQDSVEGCSGCGQDSTERLEPQPKGRRPGGNGPSSGSCFPCPQPQSAALGSQPARRASVNSDGVTGQRPCGRVCGRWDSCGCRGGQ